jgi:hypothetical protein
MQSEYRETPVDKPQIEVRWGDQIIHLENAFIGGRWVEEDMNPIGFYGGKIDIGEMAISLMNLLRGVIQITGQECHLSPEKREDFLISCVAEALRREEATTKDDMIHSLVKRFMDNQN